jgi:predicted regulator of Ras-like GTPase activity (Roadblock/LC7/MglB family)
MDINNGKQLILSEEVYNGISKVLDELAASTRADLIVFCESNGYPVVHKGSVDNLDLPIVSSLAANNFSATAKLAAMLGENDAFKFLFHEGEHTNMYLSNVGFNFILLVIFDVEVALGIIRIYTKKAIDALTKLLNSVKDDEKNTKELFDLEFKTLLSEELSRSLKM